MKLHQDITLDRVTEAVGRAHSSLVNPGFCVCCGVEADGVELDARKYECEFGGKSGVYSA